MSKWYLVPDFEATTFTDFSVDVLPIEALFSMFFGLWVIVTPAGAEGAGLPFHLPQTDDLSQKKAH
ncbi:hypothetical protein H6785_03845 [Candidatus Nomurabacteria bacterium]|nr:hypothetical protein [Candidatus Nomurabacteria bacterium]